MSLVSLVKIPKDIQAPLKEAISQSLNLIDYRFDKNIKRVVIKPNLCYYWDSSTGQTTTPKFVGDLIDLIRQQTSPDVDIAIVESDASAMRTKYAFRMLGYDKLAQEKGVRLLNLTDEPCGNTDVSCNGKVYNFMVPKVISEADLRINIAHIKYTVNPIKLTCALKNIFGCNPFPKKSKYHADLGNVIVALNKAMKFDLCLIDSNIAAGVQPRKLGLVMASQDPVAIDAAAAKIAWLDPSKIPYFALAEREGLGKRAYETRGERLEHFRALYPKVTFKMKVRANLKRTLIGVGLGKRLGLV
ncbi:MAG: DUF362 domain-containing protein [Candidatus Bathyarchaeota archaeon]|nr:DUF362 domain-containing protein [Candidatus Bathyarchaeota archaeon]